MNTDGVSIGVSAVAAFRSHTRSRARYQFGPPVNPVRVNSPHVVLELLCAEPGRRRCRGVGQDVEVAVSLRGVLLALHIAVGLAQRLQTAGEKLPWVGGKFLVSRPRLWK